MECSGSGISILFTDDREIARLNESYRGKIGPTDVLSFASRDALLPGPLKKLKQAFLGDLVISVDTLIRQAKTYRVTPREELLRLLVHGTLHLLGYDHEGVPKNEAERMRRLERKVLANMLRSVSLLLIVLVFSVDSRADVQSTDSHDNPVRISLIQSLTGVAAVDGNTVVKAARLAEEEINSQPGQPRLVISVQDDQSDGKLSVSSFHHELIEKPDAILGGTWSFLINALSPLAMQTKTVLVNSSTLPDCVQPERYGGYVFTVAADAAAENSVFAAALTKDKTAVIVTGPTSYSEVNRAAFLELAARSGVKILDDIRYDSISSVGAEALIPKIKRLQPDLLYLILVKEAFDPFIRRLHELKVNAHILADKNGWYAFQATADPRAYEGICFSYPKEGLQQNPQFVASYQKHYGTGPQIYADNSFDAIHLLYAAVLRARESHQTLAEVLPTMKFGGVAGPYSFAEAKFLPQRKSSLLCVRDGAAKSCETKECALP